MLAKGIRERLSLSEFQRHVPSPPKTPAPTLTRAIREGAGRSVAGIWTRGLGQEAGRAAGASGRHAQGETRGYPNKFLLELGISTGEALIRQATFFFRIFPGNITVINLYLKPQITSCVCIAKA